MKLCTARRRIVPRAIARVGLAALALVGPRASTAACPPAAVVEGSAEIAQPVSLILRRHGVGAGPSACGGPTIRAVLTKIAATTTYALHIVDGYGRTSDRQVADFKDAASLIESWATEEDADAFLPRPPPALPAVSAVAPPPAPPADKLWYVLAATEISRASDDSTWYGGAATFCRRLRLGCAGARVRVARDGGQTSSIGASSRTAVDGSIVAAIGLARGRLTVAPLVALGARWTHSTLVAAPLTLSSDDVGLHAEAATTVAWAFARRWSLVAEVGGAAGIPLRGRGDPRPPFFTLAGVIPSDPIPRPPSVDLHLALGLALAP